MFPKPIKREKVRKQINKRGPVTRARLKVVEELDAQWSDEPWYNTCEIKSHLLDRGLLSPNQMPCILPYTWAHARKHRPKDAPLDSPLSHYTAARGCSFHHMSVLDLLNPEITEAIVMAAIAGRDAK